jgi:hypothetical protein
MSRALRPVFSQAIKVEPDPPKQVQNDITTLAAQADWIFQQCDRLGRWDLCSSLVDQIPKSSIASGHHTSRGRFPLSIRTRLARASSESRSVPSRSSASSRYTRLTGETRR